MSTVKPPEGQSPEAPARPQRLAARVRWWWAAIAGALCGVVQRLIFSFDEGPFTAMMASFVTLVPIVVASVAVYLAELTERRSWSDYFVIGVAANGLFVLGTLLILIEGIICAVLIVPLFAFVGGVSGLIAGAACRLMMRPRRALYCVAALPLVLGAFEQHIPLPEAIDTVTRSRIVAAPPERIWPQLLDTPRIAPSEMDEGWMYRIGVPVPLSAATQMSGGEIVRHITMGKGIRFNQVAIEWQPLERVVWAYRFAPDSIPPGALDDHVQIGGRYFDLIDTEYALEPAAGGTLVTARMRYRVSTHFNWYARPLARLLVGNFEETALAFYARRAE